MNRAASFRKRILGWYRVNRRDFEWRLTRDPYRILVSEVMLQQTQAARVVKKYPEFLSKYPTLDRLASASRADVVRSWNGMGYNNRAVRLHAAVREIEARYGGGIPADPVELGRLPGIGRYTAHAVAAFAYDARVPVVDVNIRRVLSRVFARMNSPTDALPDRRAWSIAGTILPKNGYEWNQALMDFGSAVCRARNPLCGSCPAAALCMSRRAMSSPVRTTRRAEPSSRGVPLRIWRGRIVEALRKRGDAGAALSTIAAAIGLDPPVMNRLAESLERDGIVTVRGGRNPAIALAS